MSAVSQARGESGRRRRKESANWTLGQSFNGGQVPLVAGGREESGSEEEEPGTSPEAVFISKLPSAVATVPQEDVRSYIHSKRVTSYLVGNTLGEGSFAKVKEGFHFVVGEKVAIKIIDKKKALQDSYVHKNFRREAKLLQMVHHPNILQLLEVVETDNSYYLITELCSGGELMKHIYNEQQLGEEETRKYMRQMVSAVDHMHRAGIIHRDLKVENLLLDAGGNVKIIDFGLSNEEFTLEEGQRIHCSTQCGSPAYAAPELLGHKPYGPEVDIWSLGVNMYAMLTGCLPYTVEPFNITALHAKMLENKMNPIPSSLSRDCINLLHGLLTSDPARRIKMPAIMDHPWMTADGKSPLRPHPYPNRLTANDVNEDIVEHVVHALELKDTKEEVMAELLTDRPTAISAIYHLFQARLDRYNAKNRPKVKLRKKSKYEAQIGHRPSPGDDDCRSTLSYNPARRVREQNPHRPQLQPVQPASRMRVRRNTLPTEMHMAEISKMQTPKNLPPVQNGTRTLPRPLRKRPDTTLLGPRAGQDGSVIQRPTTHLNPVRPPPKFPTSISHPKDLNKLRQELHRQAWGSQQAPSQASLPSSRAGSRHPSRPTSRQPSATHSSQHNSTSHNRRSCPEYDDLEFHEVESIASSSRPSYGQRRVHHRATEDANVHFPSLTGHGSRGNHHRSHSHEHREHLSPSKRTQRTNGHWSPSMQFEFASESSVSGVLSQLSQVAGKLNISHVDQRGNTVYLRSQSVKFQVHVDKDGQHSTCRLEFQWLQGGSQEHYAELCSRIYYSLTT